MASESSGCEGVSDDSERPRPWAQNSRPVQEVGAARPRFTAKLWWLLVFFCFVLMTLLSAVLTVLWYRDHKLTLDQMQLVYGGALRHCNVSFSEAADDLVERIQGQLVRRAHERVREYMRIPEIVVSNNVNSLKHGLGLFQRTNVGRTFEVLWMQLKEWSRMSDNCYSDYTGVVACYEHIDDGANVSYLAIYRPPDASVIPPFICSTCSELAPGHAGIYNANNSTGAFEQQRSVVTYDLETRPWYRLAVEARGERAWTRPFTYKNGLDIGVDSVQAYMEDGRPHMIFDASISLRFLTRFLQTVHQDLFQTQDQSRNAAIFIVDVEGRMVASSRGLDKVLADGPGGMYRRTWRELRGNSVRAALTPLNQTGVALPLPTSSMFSDAVSGTDYLSATLHYEGGPYLCSYGTLKFQKMSSEDAAVDWIIVSIVRKVVIMRKVDGTISEIHQMVHEDRLHLEAELEQRTRWTVVMGVLVTLLGGAVMACVARAITMPIRRISAEMRSIAELKFMDSEASVPREEDVVLAAKSKKLSDTSLCLSNAVEGSSGDITDSCGSDSSSDVHSEAEPSTRRRRQRCSWPHGIRVAELVEMRNAFASMSSGLQSFAKYVDPHVVELLVRGGREAQLGVEEADVTIFFSDIANFTTMGEHMDPELFMGLLSEYLEEMSSIIMRTKGVVGEYIGDGIMAWWNVPRSIGERHTVKALSAALEQQQRLGVLRREWRAKGFPDVRVRMGLVRGTVLAGNVGSRRRMKFGLVGDSVNLASRLEALCKRYGVYVLVDGSVHDAPGVVETFVCRPLDLVIVKGRRGTTELFELVAARSHPDDAQGAAVLRFAEEFAEIQKLYRSGNFQGALSLLEAYLRCWPDDRPAQMLLERCRGLLGDPPGPGWSPVVTLSDK